MAETVVQFFVDTLGGKVSSEFIIFLISLLPILELRGGIIAAKILGVSFMRAFAICFIGNILPVPFILLFVRKIFSFLKRFKKVQNTIEKLEARSIRKADKIVRYRLWGLLLLVAIPLPGTGAWTGALAADLLDIRIKHSFPVICVGVLIAGLIISAFSYGLFGLIGM